MASPAPVDPHSCLYLLGKDGDQERVVIFQAFKDRPDEIGVSGIHTPRVVGLFVHYTVEEAHCIYDALIEMGATHLPFLPSQL